MDLISTAMKLLASEFAGRAVDHAIDSMPGPARQAVGMAKAIIGFVVIAAAVLFFYELSKVIG